MLIRVDNRFGHTIPTSYAWRNEALIVALRASRIYALCGFPSSSLLVWTEIFSIKIPSAYDESYVVWCRTVDCMSLIDIHSADKTNCLPVSPPIVIQQPYVTRFPSNYYTLLQHAVFFFYCFLNYTGDAKHG